MIGFLNGIVAARTPEGCFVDVRGIGYRVTCSTATLTSLPPEGQVVRLWTHLYVREDALALFGFASESEQRMFEACLSVGSVGPKVALQICSAFSPPSFQRALVTEDVEMIASVPGIGKKTAQRIVLELKEKLSIPDLDLSGGRADVLTRARSALENLGYSSGEVRTVLSEVAVSSDEDVEEVVKSALRVLAK